MTKKKSVIKCMKSNSHPQKKCNIRMPKNDIGGPGIIGTILPIRPLNNKKEATNITNISMHQN